MTVVIPAEYFHEEKTVKLTQAQIDAIIEELERTEHNIYMFYDYDKIIKRLKNEDNGNKRDETDTEQGKV